jgi:peptidoglycan/xylan/chitin deacetylase (PgdA/CDA1 family)
MRWSDFKNKDHTYPFKFMGSLERRQAFSLGMEIGCHTMTHQNLNFLSRDLQLLEIFNSKTLLEEDIQHEIKSFCYPRGVYNSDTLNILSDLEFTSACTTKPGYINENINFLEIPRYGVGNDLYVFESILRGKGTRISLTKKLKRKIQYFFKK